MPDEWVPPQTDEIWAEHVPALTAFLEVSGQWRCAPRGQFATRYLGLDYTAVKAGLEMAGVSLTPEVWEELRLIEAGAAGELNRER